MERRRRSSKLSLGSDGSRRSMGSSSVDGLMMPPPRKMPRSSLRTDRSVGSSPRRSDASLCSDVEISFTQDERADDISWGQGSLPAQLAQTNDFMVEEDESAISEEIAGIFGSLAAPGRAAGGCAGTAANDHIGVLAPGGRGVTPAARSTPPRPREAAHEKENAGVGRKPSASSGGFLASGSQVAMDPRLCQSG